MNKQGTNIKRSKIKLHRGINLEDLKLPPRALFTSLKNDDQRKSISIAVDRLSKNKIEIQVKLYDILSKLVLGDSDEDISTIDPMSVSFDNLTPLSKKKVILFQLKKYFALKYEKEVVSLDKSKILSKKEYIRKEIKTLYIDFSQLRGVDSTVIMEHFARNGMDKIIYIFYKFFVDTDSEIDKIYDIINYGLEPFEEETLINIGNTHGVNNNFMNKAFFLESVKHNDMISDDDEKIFSTEKLESDLMDTEVVNTGGMLDFNPHLEDLNMEIGFKFLGENKTRAIYKDKFFTIYDSLAEEGKILKPAGYDIYSFYVNKLLGTELQENSKVFQHITHWEVPKDFEESDMIDLGNLMKTIITDFNVKLMPYKKYYKNYMNLLEGESEYIAFFKANSSFANENLVLYRDKKTGKRYLTMALGHSIPQDIFIYFNTQISHFLKNKTFIDETQLYADMYHRYNLMKLEDTEMFDISMMDQYKDIIKDVIWPLSLEYTRKHGKGGKPKNTLLVGVYGTSKSQTMLSLMKYKEFEYNGKKFTLNANVISFSTMDFVRLLKDDVSIKKRLADIYQNTKIPIILLLEDIDTTTEDVMIEQAMTILMDGIGSIPITIVSAVNYPDKISHRLIRPNRLENIILYNVPMGKAVISDIMETHITKHSLDKFFDVEILRDMIPQMEYWTPSHIGAFIKRIREYIDFERDFDEQFEISNADLKIILKKLPVPIGDIKQKQKDIKNWYSTATNGDKNNMGYKLG